MDEGGRGARPERARASRGGGGAKRERERARERAREGAGAGMRGNDRAKRPAAATELVVDALVVVLVVGGARCRGVAGGETAARGEAGKAANEARDGPGEKRTGAAPAR